MSLSREEKAFNRAVIVIFIVAVMALFFIVKNFVELIKLVL